MLLYSRSGLFISFEIDFRTACKQECMNVSLPLNFRSHLIFRGCKRNIETEF